MTTGNEAPIQDAPEADLIRTTERARLRALVEPDLDRARHMHADDFQLITPAGQALSKEQYLGGIASGAIDYRVWEPAEMAVRVQGAMAVVRYQARIEIALGGHALPPLRCWHTDAYELRDGRWQVVWSQATEIQAP